MPDIRAIITDFGGVLGRTEDQTGRKKWEARLGLGERELSRTVFDSDVAIRATMGELPSSDVWKHVALTLKLDPEQLDECRRDFWSGDRLDNDLIALFKSLRPRYKTAILSNAWPDAREQFTERFGLDQVFDAIFISAEERLAKPDPRLYQRVAAKLGVQAGQAVFIDDALENVEAARAVGMRGIQYKAGLDVRAELEELGVDLPAAAGRGSP